MKGIFQNPILPGYYPDPSICRKGEDYYLVTSSFEYFPGVPVFHSRDLVHWQQLGHCLDRPSQLSMEGLRCSKGIYAPTIRYHQERDLFYMITTLVKNDPYWTNVNFFVTAKDPAGPWSDPVVIEGAEGIDPSLLFDEDGSAYYVGNMRSDPENLSNQNRYIWAQRIDLDTGALLGEKHILRKDGALYHAKCPEGPHLYKINGWYYLLTAEGGTARNHSVTIYRSRHVFGPYEGNPRNPLITHRNMRSDCPISSVGHADMIQTQTGQWWAVLLGTRTIGDTIRSSLGRETFLIPVAWEEEWPVFSPETGHVEASFPLPDLLPFYPQEEAICDQFEEKKLTPRWMTLRTYGEESRYSLTRRPGWLSLALKAGMLTQETSPAFLGQRQRHKAFSVRTKMDFAPGSEKESAGMVVLMSNGFHFRMEKTFVQGRPSMVLTQCVAGEEKILACAECSSSVVWMKITARKNMYDFYYAEEPEYWISLKQQVDGRFLSVDQAGGFNGAFIGLYASGNGTDRPDWADFDWFEYQSLQED